jgi:hypothetical protein
MIAAAALAPQLGLDANNDWGPSRRLLLAAGAVTLVAGWVRELLSILAAGVVNKAARIRPVLEQWLARSGGGQAARRVHDSWKASRSAQGLREFGERFRTAWFNLLSRSPLLRACFGTRPARVSCAAWAAFVLVSLSYLWFVSVGTWVRWPGTSAYQDMQAEAFLHGQTHLLLEPPPGLLALKDPYDPEMRAGLPYLWDASLYQDRYYLYWGPVPALLLVPVKAVFDVRVRDNVLVFVFSLGTIFWGARLIIRSWRDLFQEIPGWAVVGAVLSLGWANPAPWTLSSTGVYEAVIVGGQFFLLMGVNALYSFLALGRGRVRDFIWAGVSFSMAVATRFTLVAAAGAVTAIVLLRLFAARNLHVRAEKVALGASFLLPLVLAAVGLGIYNYSRFGSPFELGHRYQLTSLDLMAGDVVSMSIRNVPPNLYNYLINPVRRLAVFPYIKPHWGGFHMSVLRIPFPPGYYSRQIAGVLLVAPFSLFALGLAWRVWKLPQRRRDGALGRQVVGRFLDREGWLGLALAGIVAVQSAVVLGYVVAAMRYQGDFMSSLILVSTLGLWGGLADRIRRGGSVAGYGLLGFALMAWTSIAGLLLGVTGAFARFEKINPDLFQWLTSFFTP